MWTVERLPVAAVGPKVSRRRAPRGLPPRDRPGIPTRRSALAAAIGIEHCAFAAMSRGQADALPRGDYFCFLLDLRAFAFCFFPGGPSGLPDGVVASPGFFCFPIPAP